MNGYGMCAIPMGEHTRIYYYDAFSKRYNMLRGLYLIYSHHTLGHIVSEG